MTFHIISIFPNSLDSYINESVIGRAIKKGAIKVKFYNPRDFTKDKHKKVDNIPYGGGPGMVMAAEPVIKAIEKAKGRKKSVRIIFLTPGGKQFTNELAAKYSKKYKDLIIVCGRYEGIDARVRKAFPMDEISVGPFVLTGGELGALIILDTISRQLPDVLGNEASVEERRIASHDVYTRPEVLKYKGKKLHVPKVLLSGDHKKINEWRKDR